MIYAILLILLAKGIMTAAWYGHLRFPDMHIGYAILFSWMIAFVEYCIAIPAIRLARKSMETAEIQTLQVAFMVIAFCIFSMVFLNEKIQIHHGIGFVLLVAAATVAFTSVR